MRFFLALCFAAATAAAQDPGSCHAEGPPVGWVPRELMERPIGLRTGTGSVSETVTTSSPEARKFYDQGLAYLHSFVWIEAARSFHQALRLDPKLAMAYVGLSRAAGGLYDVDTAAGFAAKAAALVDQVTPREKARIELRQVQVEAIRAGSAEKLVADRKKLDEVLTRHYDDLELWLIRGNVEDRSGAVGIGQYGTVSSIPFYERVLAKNPAHFGAHHYLVHSYELAGRVDDALSHGEFYAAAADAIPHAHHMYAHDLRRVGRTRDAIDRFETADRLERENFAREKILPQMDWHHPHNLDLLATSYQHQGQMKKAEEVMRRSYVLPAVTELRALNKKEWPSFLLARDRIEDAEAATAEMIKSSYAGQRAAGHVYAGQVALVRDDLARAKRELGLAMDEAPRIGGPMADLLRGTLQPYFDKLRGGILLRSGEREKGRELLRAVQERFRAIPGPDAWMQALFELESIAAMARRAGEWDLVDYTARQMLTHDAAYGGGHYMMALVAQQKGAAAEAAQHFAEAKKHWSFADADLPELRQLVASGSD